MKTTPLGVAAGIALALAVAPANAGHHDDDEDALEFEVAEIFFELNNTDGDLGIHALIDGDPWKRLRIQDPDNRRYLNIFARSRLRLQGLTEIFFESAEPTFDELAPEAFFERFPEGTYEVEGRSIDDEEIEGETEITHAMPAEPDAMVNGLPHALQCDEEEPGFDATETTAPVTISWPAVTMTHPTIGDPQNSPEITIINYEVVVETELEIDGEEFTTVFSAILPPDVTSLTIPEEFIAQGDEFKYEVLAREESWNQTALESCFVLD